MQTMKLRSLAGLQHVGTLLESLAKQQLSLPAHAWRIESERELPKALRPYATDLHAGMAWIAWATAADTWFLTGELSMSASRERGKPVLSVQRRSEMGRIEESGNWIQIAEGRWLKTPD